MKATVKNTPKANERTTLPISTLIHSSLNVRKSRTNIESLAGTLLSVGQLQQLRVHPSPEQPGKYEVHAGERRRQAFDLLLETGRIDADFPVDVEITTREQAVAESLIENTEREGMHPAEEFDAIAKLTADGKTIDQIADVLSVTPLVVERRLQLTKAAPALLDLFRADKITTEQLMALCSTPDHALQVSVWESSYSWNRSPSTLRRAVTSDEVDASRDPRVAFIGGIAAYEAAGGQVRRDLFGEEEGGGFLEDAALLERLAADKLQLVASEVEAEGWSWVEVWPVFDSTNFARLGRIEPTKPKLSAEEKKQARALVDEQKALLAERREIENGAEEADEDFTDEEQDRIEAIDARTDAIREALKALNEEHASAYDSKTREHAGVVVALDESGVLTIRRGLVKANDRKAVQAANATVTGGRETNPAGRKGDAVSDALRRSLLGHRNLAAQIATASRPDVAKVLLASSMIERIRSSFGGSYRGVGAPCDYVVGRDGGGGTRTYHPIGDQAGNDKGDAFEEQCRDVAKKLPQAEDKLWDALAAMESAELDQIIAMGVALSVSLSPEHTGLTAKFLAALDFDMAAHFTATADNYLGKVPKPLIVAALKEAGKLTGEADSVALLAMKKGVLASEAESRLAGTGWVPKEIRAPKPKAEKGKAPAASKKAAASQKPAKQKRPGGNAKPAAKKAAKAKG